MATGAGTGIFVLVSCRCGNVRLTVEGKEASALVTQAEGTWERPSKDLFDTCVGVARIVNEAAEYDWLVATHHREHSSLGAWDVQECVGCGVQLFARNENARFLLNNIDLRYGKGDVDALTTLPQWSSAFNIVLPAPPATPDPPNQPPPGEAFAALHGRMTSYLAAAQAQADERIRQQQLQEKAEGEARQARVAADLELMAGLLRRQAPPSNLRKPKLLLAPYKSSPAAQDEVVAGQPPARPHRSHGNDAPNPDDSEEGPQSDGSSSVEASADEGEDTQTESRSPAKGDVLLSRSAPLGVPQPRKAAHRHLDDEGGNANLSSSVRLLQLSRKIKAEMQAESPDSD